MQADKLRTRAQGARPNDEDTERSAATPQPADARQSMMSLISAAVSEMHRKAREKRPEWFEHLLRKAETKAAKIATQAALSPYACGDIRRGLRQDTANALHGSTGAARQPGGLLLEIMLGLAF